MDKIISTFHLDWKLIIAQLVNFTVVVLVLWYFALKPLAQKMAERTKTIEKSLETAKKISDDLMKAEEEKQQKIIQAKNEAKKIIDEGRQIVLADRQKGLQEAKNEVKKIIDEGRSQISVERTKMFQEVKNDLAVLVIDATAKILGNKMNEKKDQELIDDALAKLESSKTINS